MSNDFPVACKYARMENITSCMNCKKKHYCEVYAYICDLTCERDICPLDITKEICPRFGTRKPIIKKSNK